MYYKKPTTSLPGYLIWKMLQNALWGRDRTSLQYSCQTKPIQETTKKKNTIHVATIVITLSRLAQCFHGVSHNSAVKNAAGRCGNTAWMRTLFLFSDSEHNTQPSVTITLIWQCYWSTQLFCNSSKVLVRKTQNHWPCGQIEVFTYNCNPHHHLYHSVLK